MTAERLPLPSPLPRFATSQSCWWQASFLHECCCFVGLLLVSLLVWGMILSRSIQSSTDGGAGKCQSLALTSH